MSKSREHLKFISIQSKVSPQTADRIDKIVKRGKFGSRYELIQYVLSAFLKVADGESDSDEASEELREFVKMFAGWENKKSRIITTKPGGNRELRLTDSINIFSEVGKKGHVCKRLRISGDETRISVSNEGAVEEVIKKLFPEMRDRFERIGRNIGEDSLVRIIDELLNLGEERFCSEDKAVEYIGIEYGNVPKKKKSQTISKYEQG
jgi:Arc/MetJ-type ribon-helix-helix transcriptional regulator